MNIHDFQETTSEPFNSQKTALDYTPAPQKLRSGKKVRNLAILSIVIAASAVSYHWLTANASIPATPQILSVAVSKPLEHNLETRQRFLGQFAAVEHVEIRPQVGGTLNVIHFKDGDVVHKGDLLFTIDPTAYQIKYDQAQAQLESAMAKVQLANQELIRAKILKQTDAGSTQNVEQRQADAKAAQAAINEAKSLVSDAKFDLDRTKVYAPFSGRIGTHQISIGNLIAGNRAGTGPTTLLTTLVSLDPVYLNFDMSEQDYLAFARQHAEQKGPLADKVYIALSDEKGFTHEGTLNFVDNTIDRSSGTLHARAIVPNKDLLLTPGAFGRVRLALSAPQSTLLVPDAAVMPDQANHIVLTLSADNTVTPKQVEVGDLRGGLRVIKSGLTPEDKIIVDGMAIAAPGSKVAPIDGKIEFNQAQD